MLSPRLVTYGILGAAALMLGNWAMKNAPRLITETFNPASENNIVNTAVSAVGQAVTGDPHWSVGGAIYDATHDTYDPNKVRPVARPWSVEKDTNVQDIIDAASGAYGQTPSYFDNVPIL